MKTKSLHARGKANVGSAVSLRIFWPDTCWHTQLMSPTKRPSDEARDSTPAQPSHPTPESEPPPRLRRPDRQQLLVRPRTWDDLVPQDHPVRAIWALVQRWDLTAFLEVIRARGTRPGRSATDPQLLIALWLYATTQDVACGRQLDRLCIESDPYKWLRGGVSLNYHTINDFRVDHEAALDD